MPGSAEYHFVFACAIDAEDTASVRGEIRDIYFLFWTDDEIGKECATTCETTVKLSKYPSAFVRIDAINGPLNSRYVQNTLAIKTQAGNRAVASYASIFRQLPALIDKPDATVAGKVNAARTGRHAGKA